MSNTGLPTGVVERPKFSMLGFSCSQKIPDWGDMMASAITGRKLALEIKAHTPYLMNRISLQPEYIRSLSYRPMSTFQLKRIRVPGGAFLRTLRSR